MSVASGTLLGPYEVLAKLGEGGMGEVYRARDTRLDRTVAVKFLASSLASDPSFRERFAREARAISQLEHPNICALYDVGEHDGNAFLVMQFLEGETLASRLSRGPLPLDEALRCAIEIAGALDRAHRAGVVHRDLKPANVMLTKVGAKLLDFGLAKSAAPAAGITGLSMLPTTPPGLTAQGTILGTVQYMAPEQLEGQEADARTDMFAFGAVVYEMVTGRKAFQGKSPVSLIGAILKDQPLSIAATQPLSPPALDRIVNTCLAKDPDERWQSAGDLQRELRWITVDGPDTRVRRLAARAPVLERLAWLAGGAAVATILGASAVLLMRTPLQTPAPIQFEIAPPAGTSFGTGPANPHQAISPDGRRIAFVVVDASGRAAIAVRDLANPQSRVVPGTEGVRLRGSPGFGMSAGLPFWGPDSRSFGFFADGALKKVDLAAGTVQTLCRAPAGEGGTWNRDGTIVFAPDSSSALFRVPEAGGTPTPVTRLEPQRNEQSHRFPWFLPDGRHFLYIATPAATLFIGSLDSPQRDQLFAVESKVVYGRGHLLFTRNAMLLAQPFDAGRLRVTGESFPVADEVAVNPGTARAAFSVSSNGVLTYRPVVNATLTQLTWMNRSGGFDGVVGEPAIQRGPLLSPDGTRVTVSVLDPGTQNRDVWIWDAQRGGRTRVTSTESEETAAIWSPDGSRVIFNSRNSGDRISAPFQKAANSVGAAEALATGEKRSLFATDWSQDGRLILLDSAVPAIGQKGDLWILALAGDRKPVQVTQTSFTELNARFSPDGHWIAYQSDETGLDEVYVMPFAEPGTTGGSSTSPLPVRKLVSKGGGIQPRWRRDGKELFYVSGDRLMAVPVNQQGSSLEFGTARSLFEIPRVPGGGGYDVSADGQRFLVNRTLEDATPPSITVVVNWTANVAKP